MKKPIADHLIIRKSHLQNKKTKWAYHFLSLIFWMLFIITLGAWALLLRWGKNHLSGSALYFTDFTELHFLGIMMLILGGGLVSWALYNWLRFGGKERRTHRPPVTHEGLAEYFDSTAIDIFLMHGSQRIVLHLDDEGRITQYDISLPGEEPVIIHSKGLSKTSLHDSMR
jgi:biofilm PGA synthesis protein PgaD